MANFSEDQVRQFYVATSKAATITNNSAAGAIKVRSSAEDLWFEYASPNGEHGGVGVVRSDLINKQKIDYVTASPAMVRKLQRAIVALDSNVSATPIAGQDYILRFTFFGLGLGGFENQYIKEGGAYRVKTGNTAANVYEALADLIKVNFSREAHPYVKVTTDTYDPYTDSTKPGTSTKLIITEVPQPWVLGKRQADQVPFVVHTVPITVDGSQVPWGTITDTTSTNTVNQVTNGKMTADMEWFYIGERADQFRGVGYPDNFETKYLANPSKAYDFIDIQFYYSGDAEDVQHSKKMLTLAIPTDATVGSDTLTETLIADLTTAGVTVNDLTQ